MKTLKFCGKCKSYSLREICQKGHQTTKIYSARFSLEKEQKYRKYSRKINTLNE